MCASAMTLYVSTWTMLFIRWAIAIRRFYMRFGEDYKLAIPQAWT